MKRTALILISLLLINTGYAQQSGLKEISKSIIGKTLRENCMKLRVDSSAVSIIQEPPMIFGGIRGQKDSLLFIMYVDRFSSPNQADTTVADWKVIKQQSDWNMIKEKKVTGFSLKYKNEVITKGKTIIYYNFDWKEDMMQ